MKPNRTLPPPSPLSDHKGTMQSLTVETLENFRKPLLRYFTRQLGSTFDAEDLVQDVFLRILKRQSDSRIEEPKAFLFRAAANTLKDHLRLQRRKKHNLHIADTQAFRWEEDERCEERVHLARRNLNQFWAELSQLPKTTQTIFIMRMHQRYPYQQIANACALSTRSVERHIYRALQHFSPIIEES
ncbi:RNA polymerase sigma factor [Alteromonas aestuariivivens]|nr:RNA polymerase sigma factor [Alteromonas aestuariivivens]